MLSNKNKELYESIANNLLDHIPGHVYWKDKEGIFSGCNEEQLNYFGCKDVSEIIGKTNFDFMNNEEAIRITEVDNRVIQTGKPQVAEERHGSKWFLSKKIPLKNSKGEVIGLFGLSMDITAQKERELNNSIATTNLLAHIPGHVYWKNKDGTILGCNEEQAKYLGLKDASEIIGKTDFDLIDKKSAIRIQEVDNKVIETEESQMAEETIGSRWFLSKKVPLKDFKGETVGVLGLSLEITEQKKLEERLKKQTQDLAAAVEAKERLLKNMSHEIRTPLQAMTTIPEGLLDQYDHLNDEERKRYIAIIVDSNQRLMELLSNLLDLSRFKDGRFNMEFKKDNIKSITERVINEFKYVHGNVSLSVNQNVPQNLVCDGFRVAQVIRNLINNSMKYGSKEAPISVCLSSHKDSHRQYVKVTIKDEGVGIPANEKEEVFEAFVESSRTKKQSGGKGLGLSIAKEIVEAHKGQIWVEDLNDGEIGARISFILSCELLLFDG